MSGFTEERSSTDSNGKADAAAPKPRDPVGTSSQSSHPKSVNWAKVLELISARKIDVALWATRLFTMIFAVGSFIPIFGTPTKFYYQALTANAATSLLRLLQRLPPVSFSRVFIGQLLLEDSCHYLLYSLIFLYTSPVTLALIPAVMFALLHFAAFSLTLLDALGRNNGWIGGRFISLIEFHTVTMLKMAAVAEIVIMIFAMLYPFLGRGSIMTPFLYYRFLALRYSSRRNHYTRKVFFELRVCVEGFITSGKCPGILSNVIRRCINIIRRLSPAAPTC